ncbi:MAG: NADH:ubiquinone reductase (Na(+)-transporting) subunit A, partial [Bacteroidales bacterium]|nr:NADH:ubiquinone reductase (Na(+)-transporting) subunit A [Bacteroidales bacterium]
MDIPIDGVAALETIKTVTPDVVAVKPTDFKGFAPRLLVKEGDKVLAGSPVLADKQNPDILLTAPVSGTVQEISRGDKRKLLAVVIKADGSNGSVDFGKKDPKALGAAEVKETILKSGLWPSIIQRPYGVIADPALTPKAIFVSAFSTAPLAADAEFAFKDDVQAIQAAITAVSKIAKVHVCVNSESSVFAKLQDAT